MSTYFDIAQRLLDVFQEALDGRRLDEAYVYGLRFATLSTEAMPKHKEWRRGKDYAQQKRRNSKQVEKVISMMEIIKQRMDAEEMIILEKRRREEEERDRQLQQARRDAEIAEQRKREKEMETMKRLEMERKKLAEEAAVAKRDAQQAEQRKREKDLESRKRLEMEDKKLVEESAVAKLLAMQKKITEPAKKERKNGVGKQSDRETTTASPSSSTSTSMVPLPDETKDKRIPQITSKDERKQELKKTSSKGIFKVGKSKKTSSGPVTSDQPNQTEKNPSATVYASSPLVVKSSRADKVISSRQSSNSTLITPPQDEARNEQVTTREPKEVGKQGRNKSGSKGTSSFEGETAMTSSPPASNSSRTNTMIDSRASSSGVLKVSSQDETRTEQMTSHNLKEVRKQGRNKSARKVNSSSEGETAMISPPSSSTMQMVPSPNEATNELTTLSEPQEVRKTVRKKFWTKGRSSSGGETVMAPNSSLSAASVFHSLDETKSARTTLSAPKEELKQVSKKTEMKGVLTAPEEKKVPPIPPRPSPTEEKQVALVPLSSPPVRSSSSSSTPIVPSPDVARNERLTPRTEKEHRTIDMLVKTIAAQEHRVEQMENVQIPKLVRLAKEHLQQGEAGRATALKCMARKRTLEREVDTVKAAIFRMETQMFMLENAIEDRQAYKTLEEASNVMKSLQQSIGGRDAETVDLTDLSSLLPTSVDMEPEETEGELLEELEELMSPRPKKQTSERDISILSMPKIPSTRPSENTFTPIGQQEEDAWGVNKLMKAILG